MCVAKFRRMTRRRFRARLSSALVVSIISLGVPTVARSSAPEPTPGASPMFIDYRDVKWQPLLPGVEQGSQIAILRVDPKTQATELLMRLPPRSHVRPHYHSANETHVVVRGSFLMAHGDKIEELAPGGFNYMPSKMVHEAWSGPGEDTVLFISLDGPWDIHWTQGAPTVDDLNVNLPNIRR
jgi:mannose-6-phosphate isomerase-like protein (cupin superfamily)